MATLWLSSSEDKHIEVGDSVTLTAYMNPTGLSSSSTSSYRSKMVVDGAVVGSAKTWSVSDSNWKTSCSYTFSSAGTYEVGIALCDSSGSYVGGGMMTGTITIYVEDSTVRPSNWSWTSTVSKGSAMPYTQSGDVITCKPLTAEEWNGFVDRVAAFRKYLGINGDISALYVTKGSSMNYDVPDAMRQVIAGMNPPTAVPSAIVSGGKITAAFINGLKNSLNSIK